MNSRIALFVAAALPGILGAQQPLPSLANTSLSLTPAKAWEIPALGYGPNAWSILRLINKADFPASAQVDVYCSQGDRFQLAPTVTVEPHKTTDLRIEASATVPVLCWARVKQLAGTGDEGIQLEAFIETLKGNRLEDFDRKPGRVSPEESWAIRKADVDGRQLYVLNSAEAQTVLTFCGANKPEPKACERKGANPVHRVAEARQAVVVEIKKLTKKYLILESSHPGRAILQVFDDGPGRRRVYSSESSISFDTPENDTPEK